MKHREQKSSSFPPQKALALHQKDLNAKSLQVFKCKWAG